MDQSIEHQPQCFRTKQQTIDKDPFGTLKISDASVLDTVEGREICAKCFKSRKFFCYTCCVPVIEPSYFPRVKLPIKIDIIKHSKEIDGKSTAIHATILAPEDVKIYTYPDFPEFATDDKVVLIFPGKDALSLNSLFSRNNKDPCNFGTEEYPITRAVLIDSTWHQTKSIYKDQRLRDLPCVTFNSRISQFWRHQRNSPRWYLATIEALHQFLVELHKNIYGNVDDYASKNIDASTKAYCGQYDNLLYLFKYMYVKIHSIYDHNQLKAYKRPLI